MVVPSMFLSGEGCGQPAPFSKLTGVQTVLILAVTSMGGRSAQAIAFCGRAGVVW